MRIFILLLRSSSVLVSVTVTSSMLSRRAEILVSTVIVEVLEQVQLELIQVESGLPVIEMISLIHILLSVALRGFSPQELLG